VRCREYVAHGNWHVSTYTSCWCACHKHTHLQEEQARAQEAADAAKAIKDECEADLAVVGGAQGALPSLVALDPTPWNYVLLIILALQLLLISDRHHHLFLKMRGTFHFSVTVCQLPLPL
jgi:hypothetical protein